MKKRILWLLIPLLLIALGAALLHSPGFHQFAEKKVAEAVAKQGWSIEVGASSGAFPFSFDLNNVQLQKEGLTLQIHHLHAKLSIWELLRGALRFTKLEIDQICLGDLCLTHFNGALQIKPSKIKARGSFELLSQHFFFDGYLKNQRGALWVESPWGKGLYEIAAKEGHYEVQSEDLKLFLFPSHFSLRLKSLEAEGSFGMQQLEASFQVTNLHDFPLGLYGRFQGKAVATTTGVEIEGKGERIYYGPLFCETLFLQMDLGKRVELSAAMLSWKELRVESLQSTLEKVEGGWESECSLEGTWHHPLSLRLEGFLQDDLTGTISKASGLFYDHPFRLIKPFSFSPTQFGEMALAFDEATLLYEWKKGEEGVSFALTFQQFPLDLFSLNPLEVPILGTADAKIFLEEVDRKVSGHWDLAIDQFQAGPIQASGQFSGGVGSDQLTLLGHLGWQEKKLIALELTLPVRLSLDPFQMEPILDKDTEGTLFYEGRAEDLLDFFDLGTQHISGDVTSDLRLSGTLRHPRLKGELLLRDGSYENYLTGARWVDLTLSAYAKEDVIALSATGADLSRQGTFEATGEIWLLVQDKLPFHFDIELKNFAVAGIDLVSANAQGNLTLVGNLEKADLQGRIELLQTSLQIPSHIPRPIPELTVVYRNALKPMPEPVQTKEGYPIAFAIAIDTPGGLKINGRGLSSEWDGAFHLTGTNRALSAEGKMELKEGEFRFAGRSFQLTEGALSFLGRPRELPYLNLTGVVQVKDVEIIARLKGPLNHPQITLQSSPPLPMSSIVSYLLFGQEVGEINSFQALQLATTITSFAGENSDVLEKTRKALGVDRLEIISLPSDNEELTSNLAIQVGKYVGEGILISYSQGPEDSAGNISIEIEIPKGLTIQLENDQRQEQGKFTIKWNYNY